MDRKLAQEFEAAFSGKTYDAKQIENELFSIALKHKLPACVVILKFYDWAGITKKKDDKWS